MHGVVYNETLATWVAVGQANPTGTGKYTIAYSSDGVTWTGVADTSIFAAGGGSDVAALTSAKFVAVGDGTNNTISWSTDGINWHGLGTNTFSYIGSTVAWDYGSEVAWNGSIWVAVGYGSTTTNDIAWSTDGKVWTGAGMTGITGSSNGNSIFSTYGSAIAWNDSMWIALGEGTNSIAYSYNGKVWTGLGTTIFGSFGNEVVWNGSIWVAVGCPPNNSIAYSYNGTNWTGLGLTIFSTYGISVAWNGSMWVGVGYGANHSIAWSSNGTAWTGLGKTIFSDGASDIVWNGLMWVAVGQGTNAIAWSNDGTSWIGATNINGGSNSITIFSVIGYGVAWNGSMWVAVGCGTSSVLPVSTYSIAWSNDGKVWTPVANSSSISPQFSQVAWNGSTSTWVAVGTAPNSIAYSIDGKVWTAVANASLNAFSTRGNTVVALTPVKWNAIIIQTPGYIYNVSSTTMISFTFHYGNDYNSGNGGDASCINLAMVNPNDIRLSISPTSTSNLSLVSVGTSNTLTFANLLWTFTGMITTYALSGAATSNLQLTYQTILSAMITGDFVGTPPPSPISYAVSNIAVSGFQWTQDGNVHNPFNYVTNVSFTTPKLGGIYGCKVSYSKAGVSTIVTVITLPANGLTPNVSLYPLDATTTYTAHITLVNITTGEELTSLQSPQSTPIVTPSAPPAPTITVALNPASPVTYETGKSITIIITSTVPAFEYTVSTNNTDLTRINTSSTGSDTNVYTVALLRNPPAQTTVTITVAQPGTSNYSSGTGTATLIITSTGGFVNAFDNTAKTPTQSATAAPDTSVTFTPTSGGPLQSMQIQTSQNTYPDPAGTGQFFITQIVSSDNSVNINPNITYTTPGTAVLAKTPINVFPATNTMFANSDSIFVQLITINLYGASSAQYAWNMALVDSTGAIVAQGTQLTFVGGQQVTQYLMFINQLFTAAQWNSLSFVATPITGGYLLAVPYVLSVPVPVGPELIMMYVTSFLVTAPATTIIPIPVGTFTPVVQNLTPLGITLSSQLQYSFSLTPLGSRTANAAGHLTYSMVGALQYEYVQSNYQFYGLVTYSTTATYH